MCVIYSLVVTVSKKASIINDFFHFQFEYTVAQIQKDIFLRPSLKKVVPFNYYFTIIQLKQNCPAFENFWRENGLFNLTPKEVWNIKLKMAHLGCLIWKAQTSITGLPRITGLPEIEASEMVIHLFGVRISN